MADHIHDSKFGSQPVPRRWHEERRSYSFHFQPPAIQSFGIYGHKHGDSQPFTAVFDFKLMGCLSEAHLVAIKKDGIVFPPFIEAKMDRQALWVYRYPRDTGVHAETGRLEKIKPGKDKGDGRAGDGISSRLRIPAHDNVMDVKVHSGLRRSLSVFSLFAFDDVPVFIQLGYRTVCHLLVGGMNEGFYRSKPA